MEAQNAQMDMGSYGTAAYLEGRKPLQVSEAGEAGLMASDFLLVDNLLDFSNEEIAGPIGEACNTTNGAEFSSVTDTNMTDNILNCKREFPLEEIRNSYADFDKTADLCVPCDDVADLEWLSNFVEDSFSTGSVSADLSGTGSGKKLFNNTEMDLLPVPAKARSKRSRAPVCNWVSYVLSPTSSATKISESGSTSAGSETSNPPMSLKQGYEGGAIKLSKAKKKSVAVAQDDGLAMRKCTHCGTQKTPQWRAGPEGPKTLCNACGVRFKSGRLLPEYRPAASPTFVVTQHSNSHRKVLEMRRQKQAENHKHHLEELVQGLMQTTSCDTGQSYIDKLDEECLLHTSNNSREASFCRV